jgi:hypothetical protein
MEETKKKKTRKKKEFRYATSFTMRFDNFSLEMIERIAYDEDTTKPEAIRSAVKFLFLKKYGDQELEKVRKKHRPNFNHD